MREQSIASLSSTTGIDASTNASVQDKGKEEKKEIIPIDQIHSLLHQQLKFEEPGAISAIGVDSIRDYLVSKSPYCMPPAVDDNFEWTWQTKKGNLPKRLGKWYKKVYAKELDPTILAHVGNLAMQHSSKSNDIYYFIVTDKIDWASKQFGQSSNGSCWWSSGGGFSSASRYESGSYCERFLAAGGLAIKFYPTGSYREYDGIGRLWLMVEPEMKEWAMLLNGYWHGQGATMRLARVFASYLGLSYCKQNARSTHTSNHAGTGGIYYVNSYTSYLVGTQQALNKVSSERYIHVPRVEPKFICSHCQGRFPEADGYHTSLDGDRYCYPCQRKVFKSCQRCMNNYLRDVAFTTVSIDGYGNVAEWCDRCVATKTFTCPVCQKLSGDTNYSYVAIRYTAKKVCSKACYKMLGRCQECKVKTDNEDAYGVPLCILCEEEFEQDISLTDVDVTEPVEVMGLNGDRWGGCHCAICSADRELSEAMPMILEADEGIEDFSIDQEAEPFER